MRRLNPRVVAITLLCTCLLSPTLGQDKQGMEKIERHKDIAGLMSTLHNWGVNLQVGNKLEEAYPRILSDLEYAGSGGVLVVARFEKIVLDSGTYHSLVSNQLDYVGIGGNDVEAEMANLVNGEKPFYTIRDGYTLDLENSTSYWFKKSTNVETSVREKPLDLLRREVINEIVRRKLGHYDWNAARSVELTRLSKIMTAKVGQDNVNATTTLLLGSRDAALAKHVEINSELRKQLDRARKAQDLETTIKALDFLQSYVSTIDELAGSTSPEGRALTKEEALSRLGAIKNDANSRLQHLQKELDNAVTRIQELDQNVETLLRDNRIPTDNLPLAFPPVDNPWIR
jgi:hypothetical protein